MAKHTSYSLGLKHGNGKKQKNTCNLRIFQPCLIRVISTWSQIFPVVPRAHQIFPGSVPILDTLPKKKKSKILVLASERR